jgi:hypothetical protein
VSLPESNFDAPRGVLVPKPRTTIYTVLLGIAAVALMVGCALMALEIWRYGSVSPPAALKSVGSGVTL